MVYEHLFTIEDRAAWQAALPATASVFGSVEYATIVQTRMGNSPRLFMVEAGASRIAYPFVQRSINALPLGANLTHPLWDTFTPEYTGPLKCGPSTTGLSTIFTERHHKYYAEQHIVAEFAHLHPWHDHADVLNVLGVELNREIVYVDLTISEEQLWRASLSRGCRGSIRRAERAQVQVVHAQTAADVQEFYRIYTQTMDRRQALNKYYFSLDYFLAFREQLPHNALFVLAVYNDHVVAADLYLHDDDNVYAYLGGFDRSWGHVCPAHALTYAIVRWAQQQGKRRLILGGGYQGEDGIWQFKSSFSPLRAPFYVYKHIHQPEVYAGLSHTWVDYYQTDEQQSDYFPAYRAIPAGV